VMFGCVDPSDTPVPQVAKVVDRVHTALKYIEPRNLWLAPDCGLMTISRQLANDKAKLLTEVARQVRKS
jgi:methionine synthase II (cobalamin-independent)